MGRLCSSSQRPVFHHYLPLTLDTLFRSQHPNVKKKKKNTLNGGISMVSYIRFSFECVWTPPFIQGHPQLGATESELEVIPSPSSRPFPQSCLPTQMPPSCSLFPQLPRSSLLCISSLISCAANPQPSPHLPHLSRQVAQEKIAMGKDS